MLCRLHENVEMAYTMKQARNERVWRELAADIARTLPIDLWQYRAPWDLARNLIP